MSGMKNKVVANIFREFADKIENDTCGVDEETLSDIANQIIHIKLNAEQMCAFMGHISRATLTRMIFDGRVPKPHKEPGGKEFWYRDEVEKHIEVYKAKYNIK